MVKMSFLNCIVLPRHLSWINHYDGLCIRFVELFYKPVYSLEETAELFEYESARKSGNQFVEGILFSQNEGVIMTGNMTNKDENVSESWKLDTASW